MTATSCVGTHQALEMVASLDILDKAAHVNADTVANTFADLYCVCYSKPITKRKVHCLGNVETMIESCMIPRTTRDHELSLLMYGFRHSHPIFNQKTWVDHGSFVPDEFRTLLCLLRKLRVKEVLKMLIAIKIHSIPILRVTRVKVVD